MKFTHLSHPNEEVECKRLKLTEVRDCAEHFAEEGLLSFKQEIDIKEEALSYPDENGSSTNKTFQSHEQSSFIYMEKVEECDSDYIPNDELEMNCDDGDDIE